LALLDGRVDRIARLGTGDDCPVHAIAVLPSQDGHASDNAPRLRSLASGRGTSLGAAILGGLAEAAERICATHRGDEAASRAVPARAGERVIPPSDLLLYSDAQYQNREAWNLHHRGKNRVPPPIDPRMHDGSGEAIHFERPAVLAALLSALSLEAGEPRSAKRMNGCAVGSTRDEAIVGALPTAELTRWQRWYSRLRPAVNLDEQARSYPGYARVAGDADARCTSDLMETFRSLSPLLPPRDREAIASLWIRRHFDRTSGSCRGPGDAPVRRGQRCSSA
jgi:hypothetical protein